jgi:hypothetical protein
VILGLAATAAFGKVGTLLTSAWPAYFPPRIDLAPGFLDAWSPALASLSSALLASIAMAAGLAVLIAVFQSGWSRRAWWFWLALLLFLVALGPTHAHSVREFFVVWLHQTISFGVIVWLASRFLRDNAHAYVASIFCILVAKPVSDLVSQGARSYQWNGLVLAVLSLIILGWLLLPAGSVTGSGEPREHQIIAPAG